MKNKVLILKENNLNKSMIKIPKGSILFVKNKDYVNVKQIVLELPQTESLGIKCKVLQHLKLLTCRYYGKVISSSLKFKNFVLIENLTNALLLFLIKEYLVSFFRYNTKIQLVFYEMKYISKLYNFQVKYIFSYFSLFKFSFLEYNEEFLFRKLYNCNYIVFYNNKYFCLLGYFILQFNKSMFSGMFIEIRMGICVFVNSLFSKIKDVIFWQKLFSRSKYLRKSKNVKKYVYYKLLTEDITRSLKRVDFIFEGKSMGTIDFNRELKLDFYFLSFFNSLEISIRKSVERIQLSILDSIQLIYQSQGVFIANKHIELVIKEMTRKVVIFSDANYSFLPGQTLDLFTVSYLNIFENNRLYFFPIVLGISNIVRLNDSFITRFCFQELKSQLVIAILNKKIDWLRGLRENLFLCKLIPFGTGW